MQPSRKPDRDIEPDIRPRFGVVAGGGESTDERANLRSVAAANDLKDQERNFGVIAGGGESTPERADLKAVDPNKNIDATKDAEQNPHTPSPINYTGGTQQKVTGKGRFFKRKGPLALMITIFFGGAVGLGGFFGGPGLLIVNMSEVIGDKLNSSLASLDVESHKIVRLKLQGSTSGVCSTRVSVLCKYTTLSKDNIASLADEGVTIKDSSGKVIDPTSADTPNKARPATYNFEGEDIAAKDFPSRMANNVKLQTAVQKGLKFNPKFASVNGKAWRGAGKLLGISKQAPFDETDTTDAKRLAKIEETTKDGTTKGSTVDIKEGDPNEACKNPSSCTADEAKNVNEANAKANGLVADKNIPNATNALDDMDSLAKVGKAGLDGMANTIKLTGYLDNACSIRATINGIGVAAKTVRYEQLARFAMIFLTTASMIKAGTAQQDDTNYLGNMLMNTVTRTGPDGKQVTTKTAPDSVGYQNLAFGDHATLDTNASQYLTAAGLTGVLIGVTATLDKILGGPLGAKSTCGALANPLVQIGSLLGGIALFFIPGVGQAAFGIKEALQIAGGGALIAAQFVLPAMLKDVIAGTVINDQTFGEAAGNAYVSGAGATFSTVAQFGGNAPLTPDQAASYQNFQTATLDKYAKQDQLAYSPLDPTHASTFMGTLFTQMTRYSGSLSTVGGVMSTAGSLVTNTFGTILSPYTKADSSAQDFQKCQDEQYKALNGGKGVATDDFCNIKRGIPKEYLDNAPEPDALFAQYQAAGYVDETGAPTGDYKTYVDKCMMGSIGQDPNDDDAECFINNQDTANKYIYYVNSNALDMMENGYQGSGDTGAATPAPTPGGTTSGATTGSAIKGDDYPWPTGPVGVENPATHFGYRECVDFVNWRLNEQAGVTASGPFKTYWYGSAKDWKDKAVADGHTADHKPALGSVAWWGPYVSAVVTAGDLGHVAIVSAVNADGSITVEQYNASVPGHTYSQLNIPAAAAANLYFLHIHDIQGTP